MKTIKLLYLEHDDMAIRRFERSLRNTEIHIDHTVSRGIDEAIKLLKINKYDLILTDVLWPDLDTGVENNKLFPVIIKKLRNENSRIPIIAFSEKGDAHKEVEKEEDEIYDIWSKSAGYPEFLPYRIKHFVCSWQNEMAEKALIEFLEIFLANNPDCWGAKHINNFIECYSTKLMNAGDLFTKIIILFKDLSDEVGLEASQAKEILQSFSEFEPLDLSRSATAWGHLRHTLSVFLIGYLLINEESNLLSEKIINHTTVNNLEDINRTWFLASTFHDTSIFLEHISTILSKIDTFISQNHFYDLKYKNNKNKMVSTPSLSKNVGICPNKIIKAIEEILKSNDFEANLVRIKKHAKSKIDHGIIGAANLYENCKSNKKISSNLSMEASFAILIHKCFSKNELDLDISNNRYIFAQLLCLVDSFQAWGRESQFQSIYNGTNIEKIVLREINLSKTSKPIFELKVDYLPFNYLSPSDENVGNDVEDIKDLIRLLFDDLQKIGVTRSKTNEYFWQDINLKFSFMIQGKSMF